VATSLGWRFLSLAAGALASLALGWNAALLAQTAAAAPVQRPESVSAAIAAERSGQPATVTFFNRPIVVLRARVLGRTPDERAAGAKRLLDDLAADQITGPVTSHVVDGNVLVNAGSRTVVALTAADVDELSGETLEDVGAQTVARLRQALSEAAEAHAPRVLLRSSALAALAVVVGLLLVAAIRRAHRVATARLIEVAEQRLARSGIADLDSLRASRLRDFERRLVATIAVAAYFVVIYSTVTFVLRRFPYTRPWGESMKAILVGTTEHLGLGMVNALPGLFTAALIFVAARLVIRLLGVWFAAVEQGRITPRWIYPETALPTRRLSSALVWLFALVAAYPYLPGSQTEGFKGVSVFLGLMITFGSSGLVNQIMSGFMVTYSRAVRLGDFVRIGDVEGTVTHLGVLSVKVRTIFNEEVTIPNGVIVSQTTIDYTRLADQGVFTRTSVTIGYDAPWRQVQSLLLLAAERTAGVRRAPKPYVLQTALEDFYVKYTLLVCLERQELRADTLHALHAHIQDLFNEYGVQIMSPNYVVDPLAPKVVPKEHWFAAPAQAAIDQHQGV
jgi:small-conductance mechanosensitive channel